MARILLLATSLLVGCASLSVGRRPADVQFHNANLDREIGNPARSEAYRRELRSVRTRCEQFDSLRTITDMPLLHGQSAGVFSYSYNYQVVDPGAPTVVFLPGGPGESGTSKTLPATMNHVLIDPRGVGCNFGTADDFRGDAILSDQVVLDVVEVIKALGLKNYVLYGQSYGTVLATMVAHKLSELELPLPTTVVLEGIIGQSFTWQEFDSAHIRQVDRFMALHPEVQALFHDGSHLPLGYPPEFWGKQLFFLGMMWNSAEQNLTRLSKNDPATEKFYADSFASWKSEVSQSSDDPTGWIYDYVLCRELTPTLWVASETPTFSSDGHMVMKPLGTAGRINQCDGVAFDHPYNSAHYQFSVPTVYFVGSTDPNTPAEGAKYHYDSQLNKVKTFVIVKFGGHDVLQENLAPCSPKIWEALVRAVDFSALLDIDGKCKR